MLRWRQLNLTSARVRSEKTVPTRATSVPRLPWRACYATTTDSKADSFISLTIKTSFRRTSDRRSRLKRASLAVASLRSRWQEVLCRSRFMKTMNSCSSGSPSTSFIRLSGWCRRSPSSVLKVSGSNWNLWTSWTAIYDQLVTYYNEQNSYGRMMNLILIINVILLLCN